MRFFLTSYQKSGTHLIYPLFLHDIPSITDRSGINLRGADRFGYPSNVLPLLAHKETAAELRRFRGKAFGHVAYLPVYANALSRPRTRVIINVRDPRDVVIAEYENMRKKGPHALWNGRIPEEEKDLIETDDPISWLIRLAASRWPNWLGWLDHAFVRVMHYEDLRTRPELCIQEMRAWLKGISLQPEAWMIDKARSGRSATFRKGLIGEHKTYFTPAHWRLSEELLTPILGRLGYNSDGRILEERCLIPSAG